MNRAETIAAMAKALSTSKLQAALLLDTVLDTIEEGVERDGKVTLLGFGTFVKTTRRARKFKNPFDGAEVQVPAVQGMRFVLSKTSRLRKRL